jgi:hypothetical protein
MPLDPDNYNPRYANIEDFPIQGPDSYSTEEKRRAAFEAETRLESDTNAGKIIPDEQIRRRHTLATLLFGTYRLVATAEDTSDVTLGDVSGDQEEDEAEYPDRYLDDYNALVDRLNEVGESGSEGVFYGATGSTTNGSLTTGTRDGIMNEYPFDEQDRFPENSDYSY